MCDNIASGLNWRVDLVNRRCEPNKHPYILCPNTLAGFQKVLRGVFSMPQKCQPIGQEYIQLQPIIVKIKTKACPSNRFSVWAQCMDLHLIWHWQLRIWPGQRGIFKKWTDGCCAFRIFKETFHYIVWHVHLLNLDSMNQIKNMSLLPQLRM